MKRKYRFFMDLEVDGEMNEEFTLNRIAENSEALAILKDTYAVNIGIMKKLETE